MTNHALNFDQQKASRLMSSAAKDHRTLQPADARRTYRYLALAALFNGLRNTGLWNLYSAILQGMQPDVR